MKMTVPLILASRSPRRRRLLEQLGFAFTVHPSPASEEAPDGLGPEALVRYLAEKKAAPVAEAYPDALILAADTVVALGGAILEKPAGPQDARRMLRALSGRTHTVYTGFTLAHPASARQVTDAAATHVTFGALTDGEIAAYVASGAPMDKAGAYGIQDDHGALFIEGIEGDYYTVVGLPLRRLYLMLRDTFGDLLVTHGA